VKLVLDEHLSPVIAAELRRRGHDVIVARDLLIGQDRPDFELLRAATTAGRAVATVDVGDFVELHRAAVVSGRSHAGIVLLSRRRFPTTTRAIGRLIDALDALLVSRPGEGELTGQCVWLEAPTGG
jgi:predicted nuclease of predicted toxin-antitoxin system